MNDRFIGILALPPSPPRAYYLRDGRVLSIDIDIKDGQWHDLSMNNIADATATKAPPGIVATDGKRTIFYDGRVIRDITDGMYPTTTESP